MSSRKSAAEILEAAGVGSRPGYFSGRGVTLSDLDGRKLARCHEEIQAAAGEDAAGAFVDMVAGMDRMTATGFINAVTGLEAAGWVHVPGPPPRHTDPDCPGSAFATVVETLARSRAAGAPDMEASADWQIRAGFLQARGYEAIGSDGLPFSAYASYAGARPIWRLRG